MEANLTLTEAASVLRCSADTIRNLIALRKLKATQKGVGGKRRHWTIAASELDRYRNADNTQERISYAYDRTRNETRTPAPSRY